MFRLCSSVPTSIPALTSSSVTPGLSPAATCAPGSAAERIPALGLAARFAVLLRHPVVGMHLDAQLFAGEDDLDQQRRTAATAARAPSNAREDSANTSARDLPASGPDDARHSSPVSQTSPMGSSPEAAARSYQGRRSRNPQTRPTKRGSIRNGGSAEKSRSISEDSVMPEAARGMLMFSPQQMVGEAGFELEPLCGRERSASPQAKSCAERRTPQRMVGEAGFEPATPGLEGRCSIRLSYSPARLLF